MRLLEAAGMPPGVINFLPGHLRHDHRHAAGVARPGRHPFHGQHRGLPAHVEDGRREHRAVPVVPAPRRRNRRQGLHRRASVGRRAGAGRRDRARCVRVPGPEVLGGEPHLRAAVAVEGRARPGHRHDEGHQDGRPARFPQFHERGDRQEGVRQDQRLHRGGEEERQDPAGRQVRRQQGLLHRADAGADHQGRTTSCCARKSSDRS